MSRAQCATVQCHEHNVPLYNVTSTMCHCTMSRVQCATVQCHEHNVPLYND